MLFVLLWYDLIIHVPIINQCPISLNWKRWILFSDPNVLTTSGHPPSGPLCGPPSNPLVLPLLGSQILYRETEFKVVQFGTTIPWFTRTIK